ncbi:MAG: hypothetical protein E7474_07590 [Ruminococcaceae bacterium]|nr:hypothetical protein [Oscillospiraceae bacterium]
MEIALVCAEAKALCRCAALGAAAFSSPADAAGHGWDLLALDQSAAQSPFPSGLRTRTLLLPGDSEPSIALRAQAQQVVGYGFSPRDTLTLSSFSGAERLLCLQRSVLTLGGALLEPQELPLPPALAFLSEEQALLVAGIRLLAG